MKFDSERFKLWWFTIPLATRCTLVLCVLATCIFSPTSHCLSGAQSLSSSLPRMIGNFVVSPLTHSGFLHVLMNMMALVAIAPEIEVSLGTAAFSVLIAWLAAACNILFLVAEFVFAGLMHSIAYSCVVGFSGVLFALMTFDSCRADDRSETLLFGLVQVRRRYAPLVLLVVLGVLMPGSSFVMHCCGVACGAGTALSSLLLRALHRIPDFARDSFCSRCRHFEEGPADASPAGTFGHSVDGSFPPLPAVNPPSCKGFEPFQGTGRRLGASSSSSSISPPPTRADDVV